jgi:hypothetical protein
MRSIDQGDVEYVKIAKDMDRTFKRDMKFAQRVDAGRLTRCLNALAHKCVETEDTGTCTRIVSL